MGNDSRPHRSRSFVSGEGGLETVEYAIIAGLMVAGAVLIIAAIGAWVQNVYTGVKDEVGA